MGYLLHIQIVSFLEPFDLLRLARTNKFIRSLLMSRKSRGMWTQSFSNVKPVLPPTLEPLSEPSYAALLFEPVCAFAVSGNFKGCYNVV